MMAVVHCANCKSSFCGMGANNAKAILNAAKNLRITHTPDKCKQTRAAFAKQGVQRC